MRFSTKFNGTRTAVQLGFGRKRIYRCRVPNKPNRKGDCHASQINCYFSFLGYAAAASGAGRYLHCARCTESLRHIPRPGLGQMDSDVPDGAVSIYAANLAVVGRGGVGRVGWRRSGATRIVYARRGLSDHVLDADSDHRPSLARVLYADGYGVCAGMSGRGAGASNCRWRPGVG